MSERWTLLVDDDEPTRVGGDEVEVKTLLIGDASPAPRKPLRVWRARLRTIGTQPWHLLLGILGGSAMGFVLALALSSHGPDRGVRPGVYPAHPAEPEAPSNSVACPVDGLPAKLGSELPSEPLDGKTATRRAADFLVANRYDEARAIYRALAEQRSDEVVFLHLASVLDEKLRCDSSPLRGSGACD